MYLLHFMGGPMHGLNAPSAGPLAWGQELQLKHPEKPMLRYRIGLVPEASVQRSMIAGDVRELQYRPVICTIEGMDEQVSTALIAVARAIQQGRTQ